ncbi:MAG: tRNA (adenosine(37)-N6)-dimethylallyltransferase MiaA [Ruminococcaceae bacterium]|nr:tRNA (adenosine(37)-N6)-dimethylallyltransferase MiaA [Oscillospiraceae bacterium]
MQKQKVYAVVGPTASGKTALSVELAKLLNGEIISCDSMQVYKGMDVGTAKVTAEEKQGVPHHLIDVVSPESEFSCAEYSALAKAKIEEIAARGKTPIFCGGTGLYLDSVLSANEFSDAGKDDEYRALLETRSPEELHAMLTEVDPEAAEATHRNNVKRVIRALEIFKTTGVTKTEWDRRSRLAEPPYDSLVIGLNFRDRETLYRRINLRVDLMLEAGLLDEVKRLDTPEFRAGTASDGIGYKEILRYTDGLCSLEEAVEEIKKASRNYAKRQITWFARNGSIRWIYPDDCPADEEKFKFIVNSAVNILNIK